MADGTMPEMAARKRSARESPAEEGQLPPAIAVEAPLAVRLGRRLLGRAPVALIVLGALMLADATLTVTWREPVSALYTYVGQAALEDELDAKRRVLVAAGRGESESAERIAAAAENLRRRARPGRAVGRLAIGKLGLEQVVVYGTGPPSLRKGPGMFADLATPGLGGTTGVAAHRTTFGAPFRHIDRLKPGDRLRLDMPYARFTYAVQATRIVDPTDVSLLRHRGYDRLVLSACHPLRSDDQRIVVLARLKRVDPGPSAI